MNRDARILVVDDKQSFLFLIKSYLEDAGYAVVCASSGVEALAAMEQHRIDLILSDMVMPEMDVPAQGEGGGLWNQTAGAASEWFSSLW